MEFGHCKGHFWAFVNVVCNRYPSDRDRVGSYWGLERWISKEDLQPYSEVLAQAFSAVIWATSWKVSGCSRGLIHVKSDIRCRQSTFGIRPVRILLASAAFCTLQNSWDENDRVRHRSVIRYQ